jgi:phage tail sheath protein FI
MYYPWIKIMEGDREIFVPPSGHVAGIWARSDSMRGVHKAPANEVVRGAVGLERNEVVSKLMKCLEIRHPSSA